jgi:hypothetical protein
MVVELPKCKGTRLEPMSGTASDVQPTSIDNGERGCGRKSQENAERGRKAKGRMLEPMSGTACVVQPKDRRSMMWMEGVGWLGGRPTCEGTKARNQCQEPLVSCDRRAWIEATCCSPRREFRAAKCRGTNAGTADGGPCRSCNHTAWDHELD